MVFSRLSAFQPIHLSFPLWKALETIDWRGLREVELPNFNNVYSFLLIPIRGTFVKTPS